MSTAKIAVSIDRDLLDKFDKLIKTWGFSSRSQAIQKVVEDRIKKTEKKRLALECDKLDSKFEQRMAEDDFSEVEEWEEY